MHKPIVQVSDNNYRVISITYELLIKINSIVTGFSVCTSTFIRELNGITFVF